MSLKANHNHALNPSSQSFIKLSLNQLNKQIERETFAAIQFNNELHNSEMGKTGSKTKPFLMLKKAKQLFIKYYINKLAQF